MIHITNTGNEVTVEDFNKTEFIKSLLLNKGLKLKANSKTAFDTLVKIKCTKESNLFVNQESDDIYPDVIISTDRFGATSGEVDLTLTIINISDKDITLDKGFELCKFYEMTPQSEEYDNYRTIFNDDKFAVLCKDMTVEVKGTKFEYNDLTQEKRLIIEM